LPVRTRRVGQFPLLRGAAMGLSFSLVRGADFSLAQRFEARVVVLRGDLHLHGIRPQERADSAIRRLLPGGVAVVGLDQRVAVGAQFGVKPVRAFYLECVGSGGSIAEDGDASINGEGLKTEG